jgi:hypothetical protein
MFGQTRRNTMTSEVLFTTIVIDEEGGPAARTTEQPYADALECAFRDFADQFRASSFERIVTFRVCEQWDGPERVRTTVTGYPEQQDTSGAWVSMGEEWTNIVLPDERAWSEFGESLWRFL